jgi:homoserine dehydrogenase
MKMTVGVGLLGCGTVGSNVAQRLQHDRAAIERVSGVRYELRAIAIVHPEKQRPASLDPALFTTDARAVVDDPAVDVVVELIGGESDAAQLVEQALTRGRHVVTANKDLLGMQGPRLTQAAAASGALLRFEAAAGGAIPIVRTLGEALAGDEILAIAGVINGTCTAVLSAMEEGMRFDEALARAQRLGYAESQPANDVSGSDAAHKLALLAQVAFGLAVISPRIRRTGIAEIARADVERAREHGLRLRLIGAAVRTARGLSAEVAPVLVAEQHEFARTTGAENVVEVVARDAGRIVLRGAGAGGVATASAVMGDVVDVLRAIGDRGARGRRRASFEPALDVEPLFATRRAAGWSHPIWNDGVTALSCASA